MGNVFAHTVQGMKLDGFSSFFSGHKVSGTCVLLPHIRAVSISTKESMLNIYKDSVPNRKKMLPTQKINVLVLAP